MTKYYGWIALGLLCTTTLLGDIVLFKSGDRLTGTVNSVKEGKMSFDSDIAGKLSLDMDEIQTFSTEEAITIEKANGERIESRTANSEAGSIKLADAHTTLPLSEITVINPEDPKWSGSIVAGANIARGNTHSETANIDIKTGLRREDDRISVAGGYLFDRKRNQSTNKDNTTEDKWFIRGKYDYFVNDKLYVYGSAFYQEDRINNLNMRFSPGGGLGYQWVESDDLNFNNEAGLSYVHEEYSEPEDTRDHAAIRLAYHLDKRLWEELKAFHNVIYLPSAEHSSIYLLYADAGMQTKLIGSWIMEAKVQLNHDSKPAAGLDKTDYRYILGLGYTF